MLELDYLIDAKHLLNRRRKWDLFISAYNSSERVKKTFSKVRSSRKVWWLIPEYGYTPDEAPNGDVINISHIGEADVVADGLAQSGFEPKSGAEVCVDITGFMRPQILFLLKYLREAGVHSVDMLYTEPKHYARRADTAFSLDDVTEVRQVAGFEGQHDPAMTNDVLIVGVGYDDKLVAHAIQNKENAKLVQLHSLPSLSADMYHESVLRLERVSEGSPKLARDQVFFTSANDPFATAATLAEAYRALNGRSSITNLYLCPLATKPQALGFGLFYLRELQGSASSIIFPFSGKYSKETSTGIGRSWLYPINL